MLLEIYIFMVFMRYLCHPLCCNIESDIGTQYCYTRTSNHMYAYTPPQAANTFHLQVCFKLFLIIHSSTEIQRHQWKKEFSDTNLRSEKFSTECFSHHQVKSEEQCENSRHRIRLAGGIFMSMETSFPLGECWSLLVTVGHFW